MARGKDKPNKDDYKGLQPETLRWWNDRVDLLVSEQRGGDALALTDEFINPQSK
ncbi:hypothetical protein [Synechococcus sp. UW140]|uniref:hypothetical protein n=1 Tax=Synechococcus sp. UW140 TaxID=368503 RepID=UPI0014839B99|nr:hypothetical protein [Synechococcus sp. UW140]